MTLPRLRISSVARSLEPNPFRSFFAIYVKPTFPVLHNIPEIKLFTFDIYESCDESGPQHTIRQIKMAVADDPFSFKIKLLMQGDRGVGKTSIVSRFMEDTFGSEVSASEDKCTCETILLPPCQDV